MQTRLCTCLIPALLLLAACGGSDERETAAAPSRRASEAGGREGDPASDVEELRRYRLTMDDMRKWVEAQRTMARLERAGAESESGEAAPGTDAEMESEEAEPVGDTQTLDGIAARVESIPEFKNAVEAAGLTAREYAVVTLAYMQAAMATAAMGMGADGDSLATAMKVNPANVDFIRKNETELNQLMKEVEAEGGSQ